MLEFLCLWLLLLVPGVAIVCRVWPEAREHGPLGLVALGYLASFALLAPVSTLGYALHWPVWTLALGYGLSVVLGLLWGARHWTLPLRLPRPSAVGFVVGVVLLADLLLSTRNLSYMRGDGGYHVARINRLLTEGLNNFDPVVPHGAFQIGYHTNLYHGLMAAFAWLTRRTPFEAWAYALGFAKLASASGVAFMASALLRSRFWSWTVGGAFAIYHMPYGMLSYPNTLASFWIVGSGLALGLEVLAQRATWGPRLMLGAMALSAVQVHGLYYVFAVLMVGAALGVDALVQLRARVALRPTLLALAMLLLGTPWLVAGRIAPHGTEYAAATVAPHPYPSPQAQLVEPPPDVAATDRGFVRVGSQRMLAPGALTFDSPLVQLLLYLLIGLTWPARRTAFVRYSTMLLGAAAVLYIPPLCELAIRAAGEAWMVKRLAGELTLGNWAVCPGVLVLRFASLTRGALAQLAVCGLTLVHANRIGVHEPMLNDRGEYLAHGADPSRLESMVKSHRALTEALNEAPRGATVWAPAHMAYTVAMHGHCYPLAAQRGGHGAPDMHQRRADAQRLVDEGVPLEQRLAILRHYGIRHFFSTSRDTANRLRKLYPGRLRALSKGSKTLLELR